MKKILYCIAITFIPLLVNAQKNVTKFLGIPVDGTKTEMLNKIRAKGFRNVPGKSDVLTGEFNGQKVNVSVVTNKNKVYRVFLEETNTHDEIGIKIRFNKLCEQFKKNYKYIRASDNDYTIPNEEDISYNISLQKKRYDAIYFQISKNIDTITIPQNIINNIPEEYKDNDMFKKVIRLFLSSFKGNLDDITEDNIKEIATNTASNLLTTLSKCPVWFCISQEKHDQYRILMYYDNEYNQADGEDL